MNPVNKLALAYWEASNRLCERSATIKPLPNRHSATGTIWRKHDIAALEIALDLQVIVDGLSEGVGDKEYAKFVNKLAITVAEFKSKALSRIAAGTFSLPEDLEVA